MASFQSLPIEVIEDIIDIGSDCEDVWNPTESWNFLCDMSLVCWGITEVAQSRLWSELALEDDVRALRILQSPAIGRFETKYLKLSRGKMSAKVANELVSSLRGMKMLVLLSFDEQDQLDWSILLSPSLHGLCDLWIWSYLHKSSGPELLNPPFNLEYLCVCHPSPGIFDLLHRSGPRLKVLEIGSNAILPSDQDDFVLLFRQSAPFLRELDFRVDLFPALIPLFAFCTNLEELDVSCTVAELVDIVKTLPCQLVSLYFNPQSEEELVQVLPELFDLPALSKLRKLELGNWCTRDGLTGFPGGSHFLKRLESKGVNVTFEIETVG